MDKPKEYRLLQVIVCSPCEQYFHINNLKKHNIKEIPDKSKAKIQHKRLKSILENSGVSVLEIPELEGHPNSVFTRDPALCTHKGYIKLRMGLKTRRGEEDWIAKTLNSLRIPYLGCIKHPGTVEGGDIILTDSIAFIGHSRRTNKYGIKQIATLLKDAGYEIRITEVPPPFLHLGGAMSVIDKDSILCCKGIFSENFLKGFNKIEILCNSFIGGNVISLGKKEIIATSTNLEATKLLRKKGYIVHSIDLSEFVKGTGGPTCLILPL